MEVAKAHGAPMPALCWALHLLPFHPTQLCEGQRHFQRGHTVGVRLWQDSEDGTAGRDFYVGPPELSGVYIREPAGVSPNARSDGTPGKSPSIHLFNAAVVSTLYGVQGRPIQPFCHWVYLDKAKNQNENNV